MSKQGKHIMHRKILYMLVILPLALTLTGCGSGAEPTATPLPTATPTLEPTPLPARPETPKLDPQDETMVETGQKKSIKANAIGADRYEWTLAGDGEISQTTGDTVIYTAPAEGDTIAVVTVRAYNDQGESPPASLTINVPPTKLATIGLDALAIPAGFMAGKNSPNPADFITFEKGNEKDCEPNTSCLHISYKPGSEWAGVFWWPPGCGESGTEDAWEKVKNGACGVSVIDVGNFSEVKNLAFQARGDRGGEVIEFKIGAVDVLPSPGRSLGKVTLTKGWNRYEILLEGMDLTKAVGLFLWVAAELDNPTGAVFYLADIHFEGEK